MAVEIEKKFNVIRSIYFGAYVHDYRNNSKRVSVVLQRSVLVWIFLSRISNKKSEISLIFFVKPLISIAYEVKLQVKTIWKYF